MIRILAVLILVLAAAYYVPSAWQQLNHDVAEFFWWMFPP
jgi:hypothetical protein